MADELTESFVFTVERGLPEVSACGQDLPQYAAALQEYIVRGFSQVDAALARKERAAYDLCAYLGGLAPTECLVEVPGIDQTTFTYAQSADEVLEPGSGVLPYVAYDDLIWYRAGAAIQDSSSNVSHKINPSIPDNVGVNFAVFMTAGNDAQVHLNAPNEERKNSGDEDYFGLQSEPGDDNPSVWIYWMIFPFS